MSNHLSSTVKIKVRDSYLKGVGLREISRATGASRNAIRRLIRKEGLLPTMKIIAPTSTTANYLQRLDLKLLEKMYSGIREPGPARDFENQIKSLAEDLATELEVKSRVDATRLELAVSQYILYRRFFFASMEVSDKVYCGPYAKFHEKQAKAAMSWIEASNHALEAFSRLIRELEVKAGLRGPNTRSSGVTVQQQLNVMVGSAQCG